MTGPTLVTGAAGFIGSAVVRRLVQDGGAFRAGFRNAALPAGLATLLGLAPVRLDLDDEASVDAAVAGAGAVVHAAYGPDDAMAAHCARLLAAMTAHGVDRLVHFSSIAVYGERDGDIVETDGPVGRLGTYGEAKRACEAMIADWTRQGAERRALLLRPGVVYGAGSRFWIDKPAQRIAAGWGGLGALGEGVAPLIHVDDVAMLAAAGLRSLDDPALDCAAVALNLVGPETPDWNAYFAALAATTGHGPLRTMSGAEIGARRALALPAKAWRRLKLPGFEGLALAPAAGEFALFARKAHFSTEAADRLLGPARIGLSEGLARSVGSQAKA